MVMTSASGSDGCASTESPVSGQPLTESIGLGPIDRFLIGSIGDHRSGDCVIALDAAELRAARASGKAAVAFDELFACRPLHAAAEILIQVPTWRGYRFVELLEWLVCAVLGNPDRTTVTWRSGRKTGATGVKRILRARGWELRESRDGQVVQYVGRPPEPGERPVPLSFRTELGGRELSFYADWGVFSSADVDEGTRLLYSAAMEGDRVPTVVDVGTGYGPLAVGLVGCGRATRAVATEVDAVALTLARMNAAAAGTALDARLEIDPTVVPDSELTVCNFPTHAKREESDTLVRGLCGRAASGTVLVVVHANLENRYLARFARSGAAPAVVRRGSHSVLALGPRAGRAGQSRSS
jgi:16S rRNA (guanine1207-N2)-methyltransferase